MPRDIVFRLAIRQSNISLFFIWYVTMTMEVICTWYNYILLLWQWHSVHALTYKGPSTQLAMMAHYDGQLCEQANFSLIKVDATQRPTISPLLPMIGHCRSLNTNILCIQWCCPVVCHHGTLHCVQEALNRLFNDSYHLTDRVIHYQIDF